MDLGSVGCRLVGIVDQAYFRCAFLRVVSEPKVEKSEKSSRSHGEGEPMNAFERLHVLCVIGELDSGPEERISGDHIGCLCGRFGSDV